MSRVAVVDDEAFFREAITDVLGEAGFEIVTAEDGAGALELAADPDLGVLVLDIRMPGMDGIEVLRRLREERPALRVLVLSGATDQETVLEALRLGACDYLAKPLHDEELVLAVRRAVEVYALSADAEQLRGRLAQVVSLTEGLSRSASRAGPGRPEALYTAVVEAAAALLRAGRTSLLLREGGDEFTDPELQVVATVGCPESIAELDRTLVGTGVAGHVARSGEAVLADSRVADDRFAAERPAGSYEADAFVAVPVLHRSRLFAADEQDDEVVGVLCATNPEDRDHFGAEDLALLRLLAGRVAELLVQPEQKAPELETGLGASGSLDSMTRPLSAAEIPDRDADLVRGICDALVNEVEPERVLQAVLEPLERELAAAPVSLYLVDGASGDLACEAQRDGGARPDRKRLPPNRGLTGTVLQSGNLIAAESPELDGRFDPDVDTPEDGRPGPLLCVPIRLRGKLVGLCRVFLPAHMPASPRTGEVLGAALSAAVRNVLLYRSLVESIEEVAEARREARS